MGMGEKWETSLSLCGLWGLQRRLETNFIENQNKLDIDNNIFFEYGCYHSREDEGLALAWLLTGSEFF